VLQKARNVECLFGTLWINVDEEALEGPDSEGLEQTVQAATARVLK
jgi:hypothetical protein